MLDPTGLGEKLPVLALAHGHQAVVAIEQDAAGAGRALVDGQNVPGHDDEANSG
jgi:hypothetical protein